MQNLFSKSFISLIRFCDPVWIIFEPQSNGFFKTHSYSSAVGLIVKNGCMKLPLISNVGRKLPQLKIYITIPVTISNRKIYS